MTNEELVRKARLSLWQARHYNEKTSVADRLQEADACLAILENRIDAATGHVLPQADLKGVKRDSA